MTPDALLEAQADELLKPYSDVFSEATMRRQDRRHTTTQVKYSIYQHRQSTEEQQRFHEEAARACLEIAMATTKDLITLSMLEYRLIGMTYREIGRIHECDQATVCRRILRAQNRARSQPYHDVYAVIAEIFHLPIGLVRAYCLGLIR